MRRVAGALFAGLLLVVAIPSIGLADPPGSVDQAQETGAASIGTTADVYQTFTVGVTGQITGVQVYLNASPGATATVALLATSGGNPTGSDLMTVSQSVAGADGWVDFVFTDPVSVTAGDVYAIRINTGTLSSAFGSATNVYAGGQALVFSGGWNNPSGMLDFMFRTFMQTSTQPTPSPTLPATNTSAPSDSHDSGLWWLPFGAIAGVLAVLVVVRRRLVLSR